MAIDSPLLQAAWLCLILQSAAFAWQWRTRNTDIVDIAWTLSVIGSALLYFLHRPPTAPLAWLIWLFPVGWYARLAWHLILRYDVNSEDSRYRHLRAHWHRHTQFKLALFFLFQAGLGWLFALPAYWLAQASTAFNWVHGLSIAFGCMALAGVTLADHQLRRFKQQHRGTDAVCDVGLWRYSRHPNYFFEWLHWFVYPVFLYNSEYLYLALLYPPLMLLFLLKLTGIPFAEQQALKNRGDKYREYQNRTNKFFPGQPAADPQTDRMG